MPRCFLNYASYLELKISGTLWIELATISRKFLVQALPGLKMSGTLWIELATIIRKFLLQALPGLIELRKVSH